MCNSGAQVIPGIFGVIVVLFVLVMVAAVTIFMVFLWWRIFSKAGYSGALGLLMLIPLGNLVMLCILAFSKWPVLKSLAPAQGQALSKNS